MGWNWFRRKSMQKKTGQTRADQMCARGQIKIRRRNAHLNNKKMKRNSSWMQKKMSGSVKINQQFEEKKNLGHGAKCENFPEPMRDTVEHEIRDKWTNGFEERTFVCNRKWLECPGQRESSWQRSNRNISVLPLVFFK